MAAPAPVLQHLRRLLDPSAVDAGSDAVLLHRFVQTREQTAFAALVARHGPMVYRLCRRVLGDVHAAEDAAQAAFVTLARKAAGIRHPETLAAWLHGVAYRIALKARTAEVRRRQIETSHLRNKPASAAADPLAEVSARELLTLLDAELQRLPEKYRLPVILCCLEGRSQPEAARLLGWTPGSVKGRLERGRALLHARLTRRGLTLSTLLLGSLIAPPASALPAGLLASMTRAGLAFHAAAAVPLAGRAAVLTGEWLHTMFVGRLKIAASLAVALSLLTTGAFTLAPLTSAARSPQAPPAVKPPSRPAAAVPAVAAEDGLIPRTEDAVAAGLQWLARQQRDGHWRMDGSQRNNIAATAFALLPLLAAGETPGRIDVLHPYGRAVERGLKFLASQQGADGAFAGDMYAHALATRAVCVAYERASDAALKASAQRALDFIVKAQHEAGGWRYGPGQPGDTSVTSYQIAALAAGRRAGLTVPKKTRTQAGKYLDSAASPDRSTYSYVPGSPGSPTMTAAGHLCRLELGAKADDKGLAAWSATLRRQDLKDAKNDLYYCYYATRAMRGRGGEDWNWWEKITRERLLQQQDLGGKRIAERGSWPPDPGAIGASCGRLMGTSLALLTLQTCAEQDKPPEPLARALGTRELAALYDRLGDDRFAAARRALRTLAASPRSSVPFLRTELRPAPPVDAGRIARFIADLDSDTFAVREKATTELKKLGELTQPALHKALAGNPTLEMRRRIEQVLEATDPENRGPALRRSLFAVEVLVLAGTPEARRLLEALAAGAPEAPLTRAAKNGLECLNKRP